MVFVDTTQKNDAGQPITTITLGGTVIVVDVCIIDKVGMGSEGTHTHIMT